MALTAQLAQLRGQQERKRQEEQQRQKEPQERRNALAWQVSGWYRVTCVQGSGALQGLAVLRGLNGGLVL